jgi:hypothetical protein
VNGGKSQGCSDANRQDGCCNLDLVDLESIVMRLLGVCEVVTTKCRRKQLEIDGHKEEKEIWIPSICSNRFQSLRKPMDALGRIGCDGRSGDLAGSQDKSDKSKLFAGSVNSAIQC